MITDRIRNEMTIAMFLSASSSAVLATLVSATGLVLGVATFGSFFIN